MSKPALQQFSKELRGKIQTSWNIEMDEEMMTMFLKLKKNLGKFGSNFSNKEAMRRMLARLSALDTESKSVMVKNQKPQPQAKNSKKIPGQKRHSQGEGCFNRYDKLEKRNEQIIGSKIHKATSPKITRYIQAAKKRLTLSQTNGKCAHENCNQPAQILHHKQRFSQTKNHDSLIPLCKIHHEFAHNGITETMTEADERYRKYRQAALI
jgi:hypothetical protein